MLCEYDAEQPRRTDGKFGGRALPSGHKIGAIVPKKASTTVDEKPPCGRVV